MDATGGGAPATPAVGSGDDRARLAAAYERLRSRWFWWVLLGGLVIEFEVGGRRFGFAPGTFGLAPLLVVALRAMAGALPADARPGAVRSARLATVAAVVLVAGRLLDGRQGWLVGLGVAFEAGALFVFARAMRAYADGRVRQATSGADRVDAELMARRWRTAVWGTAAGLGWFAVGAVIIALWVLADRPLDATLELSGPQPAAGVAAAVLVVAVLAPLVTVVRASGPTRVVLQGP